MQTHTSWCEAPGDGAPMSIFVAEPVEPGSYPGVMMIQTIAGVNPNLQSMAERVAASGFVCAAPDLYYRWGSRTVFVNRPGSPAINQARDFLSKVNDFSLAQDLRVAINHIKSQPNVDGERIGCIGYCFGGRVAFLAACFNSDLAAVVACYGSRLVTCTPTMNEPIRPLDMADRINAPLLSLSGDLDEDPSPRDIEEMATTMKRLGKSFQHHIFPGGGHAFFSEDYPARYHESSAIAGWPIKMEFLNRHLKGALSQAPVESGSPDKRT